jgi:GH43 family beta-xylosidase
MKKITQLICLSSILACVIACNGEETEPEAAVKPYLKISAHEKLMSNTATAFNIQVSSNVQWNVETKNSWISPEKTSGNGNMTLKITIESNPTDMRSGVLKFTAEGVIPVNLTVTQTELTFTNPIAGIPDPWIIKHGETYYLCKADGGGINIAKSNKLSGFPTTKRVWNHPTDAGSNKPWNVSNIWAPELHYVDGQWYIYYAAGRPTSESNGSYRMQRSGVLRAKTADPTGAWEDLGMLYTGDNYTKGITATGANTAYAIDLGVFRLNGQLYAVWSGNPPGSGDQWLYIATMENPYTISSSRVAISKPDKAWETYTGKVNEGPAFLKNAEKNKFFVIYSCNGSWTKQYRLASLELSDTLANPLQVSNWKKSDSYVFHRCDDTSTVDGVNGVGHCSFTQSPDETENWIVYHVKRRNADGWDSGRSTFLKKFGWNADGTPDFGTPPGWGEAIPLPAGESR